MVKPTNNWFNLEKLRESGNVPSEVQAFSYKNCQEFLDCSESSSILGEVPNADLLTKPQIKQEESRLTLKFHAKIENYKSEAEPELLLMFHRPAGDLYFAKCSCKTGYRGVKFVCPHVACAFLYLCNFTGKSFHNEFTAKFEAPVHNRPTHPPSNASVINQAPRNLKRNFQGQILEDSMDIDDLGDLEPATKRMRLDYEEPRPLYGFEMPSTSGTQKITTPSLPSKDFNIASPSPSLRRGNPYVHTDTPRPIFKVNEPLASPVDMGASTPELGNGKWISLSAALQEESMRPDLLAFNLQKYQEYIRGASGDKNWQVQVQAGNKLVNLGQLQIKADATRLMLKANLNPSASGNKKSSPTKPPEREVLIMIRHGSGEVYFAKCACGGTLGQRNKDHCVHVHQVLLELMEQSGNVARSPVEQNIPPMTPGRIAAAVRRIPYVPVPPKVQNVPESPSKTPVPEKSRRTPKKSEVSKTKSHLFEVPDKQKVGPNVSLFQKVPESPPRTTKVPERSRRTPKKGIPENMDISGLNIKDEKSVSPKIKQNASVINAERIRLNVPKMEHMRGPPIQSSTSVPQTKASAFEVPDKQNVPQLLQKVPQSPPKTQNVPERSRRTPKKGEVSQPQKVNFVEVQNFGASNSSSPEKMDIEEPNLEKIKEEKSKSPKNKQNAALVNAERIRLNVPKMEHMRGPPIQSSTPSVTKETPQEKPKSAAKIQEDPIETKSPVKAKVVTGSSSTFSASKAPDTSANVGRRQSTRLQSKPTAAMQSRKEETQETQKEQLPKSAVPVPEKKVPTNTGNRPKSVTKTSAPAPAVTKPSTRRRKM